ncbi:MAG: WD40 repeat domain-containing protein, partial [Microcystaceae cyanobacterium]
VRVWDQQGKLQKEWRGHLGSVNHVAFSADGQQVVSAGQDSTIRVWNLKSNDAQIIFQLYDALPTFVTFSPDGKLIASGDNLGNIQLWNLQTKQSFATWKAYMSTGIKSLQFNPDVTKLTAIAADGTIKVWPLENLEQLLNRGCQQLQDYLTSPSNMIVNPDLCRTK